ncbi:MAG TPA: VOC family protein [Puia sp.]|nr:VOC family protein [Puia sp.]
MKENNAATIWPFLTVSNGKNAVSFYLSAFGAVETKRYEKPDGRLMSQINIEGAAFWIGDEEPEFGNVSPSPGPNCSVRIILKTKNADALFEKALQLGAIQICPMTTEEFWRIGKLKDPFGHVWEIGYVLND